MFSALRRPTVPQAVSAGRTHYYRSQACRAGAVAGSVQNEASRAALRKHAWPGVRGGVSTRMADGTVLQGWTMPERR